MCGVLDPVGSFVSRHLVRLHGGGSAGCSINDADPWAVLSMAHCGGREDTGANIFMQQWFTLVRHCAEGTCTSSKILTEHRASSL